ncbi:glycerate kinase family protein [Aneurinibacillus sp. REN35]|uniref:glycerate kinase family protein n=1 Tax=Aneurinibacillus sp. REN35 TaxID=3237286 RepID=UPI003527A33F
MKIVIAPSGFKECLDAEEVALAMERGVRRFDPSIELDVIPMMDGGEGFAKSIVKLKGGQLIYREVTGPVGKEIVSYFGIFEEKNKRTAVIEMAAVAGLKLVPREQRNPLKTSTYGVGELILSALDLGVDHILIGCGDSGTSDGGAGMAQALGVRFYDKKRRIVDIEGGGDLLQVDFIDTTQLDPRLRQAVINVACNWTNVLCGDKGVARVFGPQKGATPEQVEQLSAAFEHYASLIQEAVSLDVRFLPGSGASGGLGAGLIAFAGASLHPRFHLIIDYINIEERIAAADIVITAEGALDFQTPNEKVPSEVARIAKKNNIPVIAITGTIGKGAELNYLAGIDAYASIIQKPTTLETAMKNAPLWIEESIESVLRQVFIGLEVAKRNISQQEVYQK